MRVFGSGTVADISSVFAERSQTICPRTDQNLFLCRRDILLLTKVCLQTTLLQSAAEREGQTPRPCTQIQFVHFVKALCGKFLRHATRQEVDPRHSSWEGMLHHTDCSAGDSRPHRQV